MEQKKIGSVVLYQRHRKWWIRYRINGQRFFRNTEETDRAKAEQFAQLFEEERINLEALGEVTRETKHALDKIIIEYVAELRKKQRHRTDGRDSRYVASAQEGLERFAREIGADYLEQIDAKKLQHWINKKEEIDKVKPVTLEEYLGQARRLFAFANQRYRFWRNPIQNVHWQKPTKDGEARTQWVKADDMDTLINECVDVELKFILYAGFHAGLRFEEVDKSSPHWFDLSSRLIRVQRDPLTGWTPKDLEARDIPITDEFLAFLKTEYAHRMDGAYMIAPARTVQGKWRYRYDFGGRFKKYMVKKGFGHICFHDLRRSFGCQLASAGEPIARIARWLGDDESTALKHYGKYTPEFHAGINNRRPIAAIPASRKVIAMPAA